jgi:hypothetical protein
MNTADKIPVNTQKYCAIQAYSREAVTFTVYLTLCGP